MIISLNTDPVFLTINFIDRVNQLSRPSISSQGSVPHVFLLLMFGIP